MITIQFQFNSFNQKCDQKEKINENRIFKSKVDENIQQE